jgi:hypothetical protein
MRLPLRTALTVLVLTLLSPCHTGERSGGTRVLGALSAGLVDSAFIYLGDAVKNGLTDDSLYYLWAEIYIARGSLDTALALSIAGQRADKGTLTQHMRTQRYHIYLALGLKKDADELLDTILGSLPPARRSIPRFTIHASLGGNRRGSRERQPYPFTTETPRVESLLNPGGDLSPSLAWFLPLKNGMVLVPGLNYSFTNGIEREEFKLDSLNHALGISVDLKNIGRGFSLGCAFQGRISQFGDRSAVNTATLSRSAIRSSGLSFSSLMYSVEIDENETVSYQAFWLMHYLTRKLTENMSLTIMPLATCFLTDDIVTPWESSIMYIEDPNADTVRHYTDASCTNLIPIPQSWAEQLFLPSRYYAASGPRTVTMTAPESYCGVSPGAGLALALPHGFSIEAILKGMVNYYLKEHEWVSYSSPYVSGRPDDGAWLAYSRSDGRYYVLDELGNIRLEKYSGPLDIKEIKKRRIDFMAGGEVLLERSLGKCGAVGVNGSIKKYHSTLQNDLPVKIKDLFYGAGIYCRLYFGPEQPLSAF